MVTVEHIGNVKKLLEGNAPERLQGLEALQAYPDIIDDDMIELLAACLTHKDSSIQEIAALLMLRSRRNTAVDAVIDYFQISTWENVRASIADVIGEERILRAAPILLRAASALEGRVAVSAVNALGVMRCRYAVERLVELLADDIPSALREAILISLGKIGDPGSVPAISAILLNEKEGDTALRKQAAYSLGELCRVEAVSVLLDQMSRNRSNYMISAVLEAVLATHPDLHMLQELGGNDLDRALSELLKHPDHGVRNQAKNLILSFSARMNSETLAQLAMNNPWNMWVPFARRLGFFDGGTVVSGIMKGVENNPELTLRAMDVIAETGCSQAVSVLAALVKNSPDSVDKAAEVLGGIPGNESLNLLHQLKEYSHQSSLEPYIWALGAHGEQAVPALIDLLPGLSDNLAVEVIKTLVSAHNKNSLSAESLKMCFNALNGLLLEDRPRVKESGMPDVRARCAWAFGALGTQSALPVIQGLFSDTGEGLQTRRWACWSLGTLGAVNLEQIMSCFDEEEQLMQLEIIYAIGVSHAAEAYSFLKNLLGPGHGIAIKLQAVWALGQLADEHVSPEPLIAILTGGEKRLRQRALEALANYKDENSARALLFFAADDRNDPAMRLDALAMSGDTAMRDQEISEKIVHDEALKRRLKESSAEEKYRWDHISPLFSMSHHEPARENLLETDHEIWLRIEEHLKKILPVFSCLSEDTRKALRSAEFYFDNRRLKVEGVDVSAIAYQYSKAIEVELARNLVPRIKSAFRHESFRQVFNRITFLDQTHRTLRVNTAFFNYLQTREHVRDLFYDDLQEAERFPKRKLAEILRQIQRSGCNVVVHGMKTIALLLLCFAMEHEYYDTSRYKDIKLPRLIPLKNDNEQNLLKFIMNLITLQNIRNRLVHHSVMEHGISGALTKHELMETRELVFQSFRLLHEVFDTCYSL